MFPTLFLIGVLPCHVHHCLPLIRSLWQPTRSSPLLCKLSSFNSIAGFTMKALTLPASCLVKPAPPSSKNVPCAFTGHPSCRIAVNPIGRKSSQFRVSATAVYKVKLIGPEGEENEIECPDDTYILDAAENAGLELPYSCRAGSCATCAGLMVSGSVDQSDGTFLDEKQMEQGYVLTCISYPRSDCVIHTHKETEVH